MNPNKQSPHDGLEPCPFCGGECKMDNYPWSDDFVAWYVICTNCHANLEPACSCGSPPDQEAAIAAWNTRTSHPNAAEPVALQYRFEPHLRWHTVEYEDQVPSKGSFPSIDTRPLYAHPPAPQDNASTRVRGLVKENAQLRESLNAAVLELQILRKAAAISSMSDADREMF